MELKISSQSQGNHALIAVRGEIDLYTAPLLDGELADMLDDGAARLVVDMSGVEFCDSTGLNVLLAAAKRAQEKGGDLELVAPGAAVVKILEITGLDRVFTVHESADVMRTAIIGAAK